MNRDSLQLVLMCNKVNLLPLIRYSKKSTFESYDPDSSKYEESVIKYDIGIMKEHVMASASFPFVL